MASFQRDGQMAYFNQGSRVAYLSSIEPQKIQLKDRNIDLDAIHGDFTSRAILFLTAIRPEDFNAPRALWSKVFTEDGRQRFIKNVADHMSTSTDKASITQMLAIFHQVRRAFHSKRHVV
jgi:catalase